ncbi:HVO_A0114 family putative DNA-binding protein [Halolamina salifodinae]|uniref:Putative transcriptional regulator n=1 Tax=Halolamina salifodinae TaxID=1202767 RepID=A0A8T4GRZ4_9EURY|nr:transcriptional regulator [Halolamina salifodinae]MBP1985616.1 putative transcriptional regulator [Halolamina salifodinae]
MSQKTLVVTVGTLEEMMDRTEDAMEAALEGDLPEEAPPSRVTFEDPDELLRVFSPRAIELLRVIAQEEPASMREAARLVDRDIKDVSRNLNQLAEFGVVEFEQEGRSKRPVVPFDDIEVHLSLRDDAESGNRSKAPT